MVDRTAFIDPWRVTEAAFPTTATLPEQLAYLLNYAVLAPSGHNSQPWRFRIDDQTVSFYKDMTRTRPVVDPHGRETTIAVGASLITFRVALSRFGIRHRMEIRDAGNPVAVVIAGEGPIEAYDEALFTGIMRRVTCRMGFDHTPVPADLQRAMVADAAAEGAALSLVVGDDGKQSLASLVSEANHIQFASPEFREEHAKWVRHTGSADRDGISEASTGGAAKATGLIATMLRTFRSGGSQAARDEKLAAESTILGVVSTPGDDQDDWIKAGMATQRILLRAAAAGFSSSMLNQPIEVATMRPAVASTVSRRDYPQMIFRMGHAPRDIPHAPRRPVGDVLDS